MRSRKTTFVRNKIAGLCWLAGLLLLLYSYWWLMTNVVIRDFWDPQYAMKRERLVARLKENPNRPLWMIIGSSRVLYGFAADALPDRMKAEGAPLVFNFGLGGANMFREFICLRRLVKDGIRPQRLGIEIMGANMGRDLFSFTNDPTLLVRARRDELEDYYSYSSNPSEVRRVWLQSRFDPTFKKGMKLPGQTLSWRLLPPPVAWFAEKNAYGPWGWKADRPAPVPRDNYERAFELARGQFQDKFTNFEISKNNDRALRQMLDLCKSAGIDVFLMKMPEGSDFQKFYTPYATAAIDSYLAKIQHEYGLEIIDARPWLPDAYYYTDGHHLNSTGAQEFTRRFAGELFKPAKPRAAQ